MHNVYLFHGYKVLCAYGYSRKKYGTKKYHSMIDRILIT